MRHHGRPHQEAGDVPPQRFGEPELRHEHIDVALRQLSHAHTPESRASASQKYCSCSSYSLAVPCGELTDEEKTAFRGVKEVLEEAHKSFDIAVVSSANFAAVEEEWARCGLLAHVDVLTTQQDGSKAHCISELLKKGYAPQSAVMCGDAPGDEKAANENGVFFYPILVRNEEASWAQLPAFLELVKEGNAEGEEARLKAAFFRNLGGN